MSIVIALTVAANVGVAVADLVRAPFVLANSAEVGVPESWLPVLGGLKLAGAAGLVLALAGVPLVGIPAAVGLVLFYTGALVTHVRAGVLHNIAFPGLFFAAAAATLAASIERFG